ncbi:Rha family transcriptional regulator [uncultured Sphaerotilus sp.]|uniref:Rha family transcriptional regulator n=1 Tax=uncultured Sphaerotilus sp. TaxID=474984 RepID=UPI0030CA4B7A
MKNAFIKVQPLHCPMPTTPTLNSIVIVQDGQPVTTTERVAAAAGLRHKNVLALVREHLADFEEFGEVAFRTRLNPQGSPTEYAELTEPQAALLFLYQRNTEAVRAFKVRMVKDFARATAELQRQRATSGWSAVAQLASLDAERQQIEACASDAARTLGKLRSLRRLNDLESAPLLALVQRDLFSIEQGGAV